MQHERKQAPNTENDEKNCGVVVEEFFGYDWEE